MKKILTLRLVSFLLVLFCTTLTFSQVTVKGKVTEPMGEALIGATIQIANSTRGTVTDVNGSFSIAVNEGETLIVSYVGYETREIKYQRDSSLNIILNEDSQQLEDVVVIGYGSQIKRNVAGSVLSVNMDKITETQAIESAESMLQGRVAGVNIQLNSGEPGSKPTVIIRGLAAVSRDDASAGGEPLYVVDGVPIISRMGDEFAVTSTNVLADLDPNDIEDMTILKDASAAAIYGSRAANGVIIITTKKGRLGRPQINFNMRAGVNFVPQLRDVAGGIKEREQVVRLYDLYAPYGVSMPTMYSDVTNPFYNNSSNWQDYLYSTSLTQSYNASVRGAGDFGQYSVSLGYMDSNGILFNTGFERLSSNINTTFNALQKMLVINTTLSLSRTDQSRNPDNLSTNYSSLLPLPDSPIVKGLDVYGVGYDNNLNDRIRLSTDLSLNFTENIVYNLRYSQEYTRSSRDLYNQSMRTLYTSNRSEVGEAKNMLFENTLTLSGILADRHNINLLLGQSAEKTEFEITSVNSVVSAPTMSQNVKRPRNENIGQSDYSASTILSFFSRINYTLDEKYILGSSLRTDGSSKFGVDNRWGIFPSVSAGWNFGSEDFFKDQDWMRSGKVRVSYGVSGTTWDQSYLALGVMDGGSLDGYNSMINVTYGGMSGFTPVWSNGFKNKDLTWVKSKMGNLGVDLSLFKGRVEFIFDMYQKLTEGLLLTTSLPTTSGYNEVFRNAADVLNRGVEFTLNTNFDYHSDFSWNTNLNFAYNKNRVVKLPDGNADIIKTGVSGQDFGSIVRVGAPLNGFFFYQSEGIYQTESEIPVNPRTGKELVGLQNKKLTVGDRKFTDTNDDYRIDVKDRVLSGNPNPLWTGGWTNDFRYKNFMLSVVSTFIIGRDIVNTDLTNRLSLGKSFAGASLPNFDNYSIWWKSGDIARYPSLNPWSEASQIITQDSEYIEDGSYFKIKSATLSYNFSKGDFPKLPFRNARLYCTFDNIITFQNYSGPDAELVTTGGFDASDGYPMRRMLLFGVSLNF